MPQDNKGRTFALPQATVMTYCHIKKLVDDCREIMDKSDLVLVNVNNTTGRTIVKREPTGILYFKGHTQ